MNGRRYQLVVTSEKELREAKDIYHKFMFSRLYVVPELIQYAGVMKSFINGAFDIFAMVDYPKGIRKGTSKFSGAQTEFFLVDGYDIILTPNIGHNEIFEEIQSISKFVYNMINMNTNVVYTLNCSLRDEDEIIKCVKSMKNISLAGIKLESSMNLQACKANKNVHKSNIDLIKSYLNCDIIISGNVDYETSKQFPKNNMAVSVNQALELLKSEEDERKQRNEDSENRESKT